MKRASFLNIFWGMTRNEVFSFCLSKKWQITKVISTISAFRAYWAPIFWLFPRPYDVTLWSKILYNIFIIDALKILSMDHRNSWFFNKFCNKVEPGEIKMKMSHIKNNLSFFTLFWLIVGCWGVVQLGGSFPW